MMTNKWAPLSPSFLRCASLLNLPLSDGAGRNLPAQKCMLMWYFRKTFLHVNRVFFPIILRVVWPHSDVFSCIQPQLPAARLHDFVSFREQWLPFFKKKKCNHLESCNDLAALLTCWKRHVYTTTSWTYSKTESTGPTLIIGTHFWD